MKNRRIAIIAFVLVAVMAIGVGYAAVSDTLGVSGNISSNSANEFKNDVYWINAPVVEKTGTKPDTSKVTVSVGDEGGEANDLLSITLVEGALVEKDDAITVTAKVKNDSDLAATLAVTSTTAPTDPHFSVAIELVDAALEANGGEGTVKITITLVNSIVDEAGASTTFGYVITATANTTP